MNQITDTILMVKPRNFGYNPITAANNHFQVEEGSENTKKISEKAIKEFDILVNKLKDAEVNVVVVEDLPDSNLPDSVFPNNWITTHEEGWVITYPMFAEVRSQERREDIVDLLMREYGLGRRYSFEYYEEENMYLEGTGSMILDRANKIVYACISDRTEPKLIDKWAVLNGYSSELFHATDENGNAIYHTNVMMAMGTTFAIICMDCITKEEDKEILRKAFARTKKEVIEISHAQMNSFAGNMLQVKGGLFSYLIMSTQAYHSLTESQIQKIENHTQILHSDIKTIEKYGGGSVRCMMAEVFYPAMEEM